MRKFLCLAAMLLFAAPASAADIRTLDVGKSSQVWFAEDHTVPMVSLVASFPAGSAYDPADKAGLAAFTASLIDEGAGNLNSDAFHEALANRAIHFSASADRDYMVVTVTALTEHFPEAMRLFQLALTRPRFEAQAIARIRTQIIQGLQQDETEPPAVARRAFNRIFYNGHPYGNTATIASIATITQDDLRGFARGHWVKGGLKVSIAGDISADSATHMIAETFKPVSGAMPPPPPPIGRLGRPGLSVTQMAVPQPTVIFGLPGIMRADPDFIPGYVANYILGGGGFSSRLTDEVRVKRGLTYGISTSLTSYRRAAVMTGSVATRANAVNQTVGVVRDTMTRFANDGPTQKELDDAKTYLTGSFPIAFASNAGIAAQLSAFQRQNLDIGYVARRNGLIQAVTLDDVRRVAKRLYDPARLTVVVAGTPGEGRSVPQRPRPPVRPTPPAVVTQPGQILPGAPPAQTPGQSAPKPTVIVPSAKPPARPLAVPPVVAPARP